jgi:hypothetical protein
VDCLDSNPNFTCPRRPNIQMGFSRPELWAAATLLAHGAPLLAETLAPAPTVPEVTVTALRGLTIGGIAPLLELSPSELESYGADTLKDLVDALKPLTRSSRSDGAPVVLINGHLAGLVEFANLPSDAVGRVEVLPETVALQYGFSENQRVLNIVLREHYRAVPTRVSESGATEGGDRTTQVDASLIRLSSEARVTMLGSFQNNAKLLESDRGIDQPDSIDRTLQPAKRARWHPLPGNRNLGCGNRRFVRLTRLRVNNQRPCCNFAFARGFGRTRKNNDT